MKNLLFLLTLFTFNYSNAQQVAFEWAKQIGGTSIERGFSVTTDLAGNVYTTGFFNGTVDFDPGTGVFNLTSNGGSDIYIQKIDSNGDFIWAKQIGGAIEDEGHAIVTDDAGNVYSTGYFDGTVDFDPGAGTFVLSSFNKDVYILKLDAAGNFIWAKQMGGSSDDEGNSLTIDAAGNVYSTGYFNNTADFDPGAGVFNLTTGGGDDIFIQKLDANGNFLWAKQMVGMNNQEGFGITTDDFGNIYSTGTFRNTVDFDPGAGISNLTSVGADDIYIQKLDASGNFLWVKQMGSTTWDFGYSITTDGSANVYSTGRFENTVDFDPGVGVFNLTSNGGEDIYVQKLDANGNFMWAKQMGGTGGDVGYSVTTDITGNVYSTGFFAGTVDFDPGVGVSNLTSFGGNDIYIQKLNTNGDLLWVEQIGGTNSEISYSITVDGSDNVYTTGYFNGTPDFDPGVGVFSINTNGIFDSYIHKLRPCQITTGTDIQIACNSYTWIDGNTYTTSNNTATWTLQNASGCDSLVTLDLTISNSTTATDIQTACESYTWIDGNTYTASNTTATWTIPNAAGCDSVITLDLTINPLPDNNVTQTGTLLEADQAGATYQWLDCDDNNAIINGETNQSYTPATTGNYAVEVTLNGCADTSSCFLVDYTGMSEIYAQLISIHPNPTADVLTVKGLDQVVGLKGLEITSSNGEIVMTQEGMKKQLNVSALPTGIYFLNIIHESGTETIRFVKQ